ncbi:hypothetical protein MNBD_PLANCTO02-805 [hydrothermal vent metagenome]|uniref:UspA domain-containing protein n=1 Tax=hydrothermal vent metagenome TaxID=652676 RepID=A0A3B1E1D0_9ZZZZ
MSDPIDEFESMFRAAQREPYTFANVPIENITLVTDGSHEKADELRENILTFMPRLKTAGTWRFIVRDDYHTVNELLKKLDEEQTDLVVTYRHLQEKEFVPQHSLGVYLDVLTQSFSLPVLVLPGTAAAPISFANRLCNQVMVVTDHIAGDHQLINYGARMCVEEGTIWLCHVEDDTAFNRYKSAIGRIPEIDTDVAPGLLKDQLLKDAQDFIDICIAELKEKRPSVNYQSSVSMGHHINQFQALIESHDVDLLIANTKDQGQLAMHGIAYSVSVEMIETALLLL